MAWMRPPADAHPTDTVDLRFVLNGRPVTRSVPAARRLVDLLREDLGLTGTKLGCGIGVCGLCSVLVDGAVMTACLLPVTAIADATVLTIEGVAGPDGELSAVQRAFTEHGGFQCGICTSGQIMAATALLAEDPHPDEGRIRDFLVGNLCRCTGYAGIVASIEAAAADERRP